MIERGAEDGREPTPRPEDGMGPEQRCGCGCGATLRLFDDRKRERSFVRGHYLKLLQRLYREARLKRRGR